MTETSGAELPPVTIGLPFSDQPPEQFKIALRSIFAQTHPTWELILMGDAASAANTALAEGISDPRVRLILHRTRNGLAARLNEIARRATHPYLFRMDADDVMSPERVARQIAALVEDPNLDVVGSRAHLIDADGRAHGRFVEGGLPQSPAGYLRSNAFTHPTVAGRTAWFRSNPYDESMLRSQDKALWLSSNSTSTFRKLSESLLFYRVDSHLSAKKQAISSKYDRVLLRRFAPKYVGRIGTLGALSKSRAKQILFATMVALGQAPRLYRRKYSPFDAESQRMARASYATVCSTPVPGWSAEPNTSIRS